MKFIRNIYFFVSSKTLTIWLVGLFIMYYLTYAVWFEEAFATFIMGLSSNNLVRFLYLLFLINITLRVAGAIKAHVSDSFRLYLRLPLYIGIVLFFVSSFMSVNVRDHRWLLLGEGDRLRLAWERDQFSVTKIDPAIKKSMLRVDDSVVFDYEPIITIMDSDRSLHRVGAFPPHKVGSTYMHILNFGLAPGVELRKGGTVQSRGYIVQRLTPFGTTDSFALKPFPYKFYLRILPNKVIKKGKETARNYDIDKPKYGIEIYKGDKAIFEGEDDTSVSFDDDMALGFFTPTSWILLEVAHDPFFFWFVFSLGLLMMGLLTYPVSFIKAGRSGTA